MHFGQYGTKLTQHLSTKAGCCKAFLLKVIVMHTKISSATTVGITAFPVDVEVDLSYGMLQFYIVGLPDTAIKESKQRVITGLKNSGFKLPERKITVNLAPADLRKEGTLFDLPIALGILQTAQYVTVGASFLQDTVVIGELSLDGSIKGVKGTLSIASDLVSLGKKRLILPSANLNEASLVPGLEVIGVNHLSELVGYLEGSHSFAQPHGEPKDTSKASPSDLDFNQVKGQLQAKRALQLSAAGRHNVLFVGPPGSGKSMLAARLPTIMPEMSFEEMIETTKIYSVSGKLSMQGLVKQRPFRSPHHTISKAGLVGGGSSPQPGEISLAHNGILFLDELTEFTKTTLEALRQPLESKEVSIARAQHSINFPAHFMLICAFNPCPCGYFGDRHKACTCSAQQIKAYLHKISGPLLDRIDIQVAVPAVDYDSITTKEEALSSSELFSPILKSLNRQRERFGTTTGANALMSPVLIESSCILSRGAHTIMKSAFEKLSMSMRGYHKTLKIARTIADLDDSDSIKEHHLYEALSYRSLDRTKEQNNL